LKKLFWIVLIIALVGGIYFGIKTYFPSLISNVIPANKEVKQYLPLNSETLSPFKILQGYKMDVFADLKNDLPRVVVFDDNGNLLVSLTSKGKVFVLPDSNYDLKSDSKNTLLTGLNKPHGLATNGNYLYVAESDGVSRYPYDSKSLEVGDKELLFSLPGGGRHFTRTIKIHNDKLYTSVGSSCDTCVEENSFRASILVSNLNGSDLKVFAKGLRNTVFFDFDNQGRIWGADMGRDMLGDNLPPEEVNIIEEGKDYGWPYCYGNRVKDTKFNSDKSIHCDATEPPVYELPAHSAPLGFIFDGSGNLFVALHGSWNSTVPVGYKVVKLSTFAGGVSGMEDFITGFIEGKEKVLGRPAGLVYDKNGNLYISDDKAGLIYVLTK
jgi:glucose/arabinose dehydrogenase